MSPIEAFPLPAKVDHFKRDIDLNFVDSACMFVDYYLPFPPEPIN